MVSPRFDFGAELMELRNRTPAHLRHFFCEVDASGTRIGVPDLAKWSTYGEALGFREYLRARPASKVLVVSTDIHLHRVALTLEAVCRELEVSFHYCPVPQRESSVASDRWWARDSDRRYVLSELVKLAAYRVILTMPRRLRPLLMRSKH